MLQIIVFFRSSVHMFFLRFGSHWYFSMFYCSSCGLKFMFRTEQNCNSDTVYNHQANHAKYAATVNLKLILQLIFFSTIFYDSNSHNHRTIFCETHP